jgi:ATP synthase protein I
MDSSGNSTEKENRQSGRTGGSIASFTRLYREAAPYLALGVQLAATVVIMFYLGYWADDYLETRPWLMLVGLVIGSAAGFYNFFKTVSDLGKKEQENR